MPEQIVCNCAACREMYAPGRMFFAIVRSVTNKLAADGGKAATGRAKRHTNLAIFVWAMRRTKQKIPPRFCMRTIYRNVFNALTEEKWVKKNMKDAALDGARPKRVRKFAAKHLGVRICTNCYSDAGACGCWKCRGCSEYYHRDEGDRCSSCTKCSACCRCVECRGCGARVDTEHFCAECSRCHACDPCRRARETVPWTERNGRRSVLKYHGEPTARYPRYIGVEIECGTGESDGKDYSFLGRTLAKWSASCHGDGSIRLPGGIEVSTSPSRGEAFEKQVVETCDALEMCAAKVDKSCGLHVHVDARDLTHKQILSVVRLYTKVEKALYEVVAPSRRGTDYTKPWGETFKRGGVFEAGSATDRMGKLEAAVYGSADEAKRVKASPHKHGARYHGLNLNALLLYGTIEFRLHQGTVNAKKILMWAAVCSAILERAKSMPEEQIQDLVGSPMEILIDTLGSDEALKDWIDDRRAHFLKSAKVRQGKIAQSNIRPVEASE